MAEPSTSPSTVRNLVSRHESAIRAASPQPSPTPQARTSPTLERRSLNGPGAADTTDEGAEEQDDTRQDPASPTPRGKELPNVDGELLAPPPPAGSAGANGDGSGAASAGTSVSGSTALGDIQEDSGSAAGSADEGVAAKEDAEGAAGKEDAQANGEAKEGERAEAPATPAPGGDSPLAAILAGLDTLPEEEKKVMQANLERIAGYPRELPLSSSWTLHFSDTSGASKSSSAAATKDAYTEGINPVFTATTVPGLCGTLKAFKKAVRRKNAKPTDPDGMGLYRAGQNLHFFRTGISPTWEDPYNEKGGRITISPHGPAFDLIYERLILLTAGASLELDASEQLQAGGADRPEGIICGVVASRRARGDRIEVWLGGKGKKEVPPAEWVDALKQVLSRQLGLPELERTKYKKHF